MSSKCVDCLVVRECPQGDKRKSIQAFCLDCSTYIKGDPLQLAVSAQMEPETKLDPKSRYYDAGGIEVQEIIKAKLTPEQYQGFCLGNLIKYALRANFKGCMERDVEKIGFYQGFLAGNKS